MAGVPKEISDALLLKGDVDTLKSHYKVIKDDVKTINDNTKEIKDCLVGSSYSKDGGLTGRVFRLEGEIAKVDDSVKKFEQHFKIIIFIGGMFFVAVTGALVKMYFNNLPIAH